MTIEEIIKKGNEKFPQDIIEIMNDDGSITRKNVNFKIRKAYMEGLIDNNIPIPSNIDDAAEEWAKSVYGNPGKSAVSISGAFGFKSGAKWMAQQGETQEHFVNIFDSERKCKECNYVLSIVKSKPYVKIDRNVLFEICDAILEHDGYSDHNNCPENDSECFHGDWDTKFREKVENIRNNS